MIKVVEIVMIIIFLGRDLGPQASIGNFHGTGDGPGFIENVACNGTETTLRDCPHTYINNSTGCGTNAVVVCQGTKWVMSRVD